MKTSKHKRHLPPRSRTAAWARKPRGSALILTLLVLLVLTGLGMTAMHSVGRSLKQSGAYRVRAQASGLANAAVLYTSHQAGKHAQNYWSEMNREQNVAFGTPGTTTGSRIEQARRGAYLELTQEPSGSGARRAFKDIDIPGETGLLAAGSDSGLSIHSFETDSRGSGISQFTSVIRDPIDGPAAPGAGESSCYKRVTVASRAMLGDPSASGLAAGVRGTKRAAVETYIGPIDCGAR